MTRDTLLRPRMFCRPMLLAWVVVLAICPATLADRPEEPVEVLQERASHIVTGTVDRIYISTEDRGNWRFRHQVAAISVETVDKGERVRNGDMLYARFWNKEWIGDGPSPPDFYGHRGVPGAGDFVRVYLSQQQDGGLDVFAPNGFESVSQPAE